MVKQLSIPLALGLMAIGAPIKAHFSDGFLGGFAGFTAGLITSAALTHACPHRRVMVYENPVLVERQYIMRETPSTRRRRAERAWHEENLRRAEYHRQKRAAARRRAERRAREATHNVAQFEKTVINVSTGNATLKERKLALKERKIELELIKAKKELIRQENRKKELALKEKELRLSRKHTK